MITVKRQRYIENILSLVIILLLLEGGLRKWLLPANIGNLFLVVRDPLIMLIVIQGVRYRLINSRLIGLLVLTSIFAFFTTLIWGHHNLFVSIYGIRIYLLYFPAMYVIGNTIDFHYISKLGKYFLYIFIPIVFLTIVQFLSPANSFVNKRLGIAFDSDVSAGELQMKASGIFTNVSGLTDYYIIVLAFIFFFLFNAEARNCLLYTSDAADEL